MRTIRQFYIANRAPVAGGVAIPLDVVRRLLGRIQPHSDGCWYAGPALTGPASNYSMLFWKTPDGRTVSIGAHRLSHLYFKGPVPMGKMVLHKCNSKGCFRPDHLYVGDDFANAADRVTWEKSEAAAGRMTRSAVWRARLTAFAAERRSAVTCDAVAA